MSTRVRSGSPCWTKPSVGSTASRYAPHTAAPRSSARPTDHQGAGARRGQSSRSATSSSQHSSSAVAIAATAQAGFESVSCSAWARYRMHRPVGASVMRG